MHKKNLRNKNGFLLTLIMCSFAFCSCHNYTAPSADMQPAHSFLDTINDFFSTPLVTSDIEAASISENISDISYASVYTTPEPTPYPSGSVNCTITNQLKAKDYWANDYGDKLIFTSQTSGYAIRQNGDSYPFTWEIIENSFNMTYTVSLYSSFPAFPDKVTTAPVYSSGTSYNLSFIGTEINYLYHVGNISNSDFLVFNPSDNNRFEYKYNREFNEENLKNWNLIFFMDYEESDFPGIFTVMTFKNSGELCLLEDYDIDEQGLICGYRAGSYTPEYNFEDGKITLTLQSGSSIYGDSFVLKLKNCGYSCLIYTHDTGIEEKFYARYSNVYDFFSY